MTFITPHDEESGIHRNLSSSCSSSYSSEVSSLSLPSPNQRWSHSTCSISKLSNALNDPSITAIETDILMGWHIPSTNTITPEEKQEDIVRSGNVNHDVEKEDTTCTRTTNANEMAIGSTIQNERTQQQVQQQQQVIMAHPPYNSSDLTFVNFQQMNRKSGSLSKHLKLDFKDYESVPLVLNHLLNGCDNDGDFDDNDTTTSTHDNDSTRSRSRTNANDYDLNRINPGGRYTIYLNADVLPGPGFRPGRDVLHISADLFLSTCLKFIEEEYCHHFAFSLGWKVDCRSLLGYDSNDIQEMKNLIRCHELTERCKGVVLAVNARVLAKNCHPFNASLFTEIPGVQLLVWTGTGEPPISTKQINVIKNHFNRNGYSDRVGYDCQVASNVVTGAFYDLAVHVVGLFWNVHRLVSHTVLTLREQALSLTY